MAIRSNNDQPSGASARHVHSTHRTTDKLARRLFAQLRDRPVEDLLFVYHAVADALAERRPNGARKDDLDRQAFAARAFRACWDDVGDQPSKRTYNRWYTDVGKARGFPSTSFLVNSFNGSWARVAEAGGGVPAPNVLARRLSANGGAFEPAELVTLLRACARDLGTDTLSWKAYREWAERELRRPDPRFPRIAISTPTFRRLGGWARALEAAGLKPAVGKVWGSPPKLRDDEYSTERLLEYIREAARACTGRLTATFYDRFRSQKAREARERGVPIPTAGLAVIVRRFGSFANALFEAGLISEEERRLRDHRRGRVVTDETALTALGLALDHFGPEIGRSHYRRFRAERIRQGHEEPVFPSDHWLCGRFGSWDAAKQAAAEHAERHRGDRSVGERGAPRRSQRRKGGGDR